MRNNMIVAEFICGLRRKHNMTQRELAETIGVSESHISKIETGERRPGMKTFEKILQTLNADVILKVQPETVQSKCIEQIQEVMVDATEEKATFLTNTFLFMNEQMEDR